MAGRSAALSVVYWAASSVAASAAMSAGKLVDWKAPMLAV